MILFPPSKINLGLNVLYKRTDGYHEIDTCMLPIPLKDVLEILPSDNFQFVQSGLLVDGKQDHNLCVKAFDLLRQKRNIPNVYMHLRKQIPMGAGLGGGSADAAYVLSGLNQLFQLELTLGELEQIASELGSDCPFFMKNVPQIGGGRGELLSHIELNLNGYYLKILNPGIHSDTTQAYKQICFSNREMSVREVLSLPIDLWKDKLHNDFEDPLFNQHPLLQEIKDSLYNEGAVYAAMSGSGSTMFGVYEIQPKRSFKNQPQMLELIFQL